MIRLGCLLCVCALAHSLPPDKTEVSASHIIKTRSIDINNAHELIRETRLDSAVWPLDYKELMLSADPNVDTYTGKVSIDVIWIRDSDEIKIHFSRDFQIDEYQVTSRTRSIKVVSFTVDPKKPIATMQLNHMVPNGTEGNIVIYFNSTLNTQSTDGYFKTWYTDPDGSGSNHVVLGTQLRPNNARKVFPCFDEPEFKAKFKIRIMRPSNMIALSNMPLESSINISPTNTTKAVPSDTVQPSTMLDTFASSPPIPTFSVGLIVADLKLMNGSVRANDSYGNNVELLVYGRPEFLAVLDGLYPKLVRVFTEIAAIWQVPVPLRKLDIIALPGYHGVKPADNWGLIVFKETDLGSRGYLQLAQEITYQWLGVMATPKWWTDAHINKALVNYIAATTVMTINNGAEMEGKWPMTALYSLYYEYSKRYPHSRITGMKQETACTKMELLFRMFNYTLGAEMFRTGMEFLMMNGKFETFTADDVWLNINRAATYKLNLGLKPEVVKKVLPDGLDVKTIACSWIQQDRLPLVTVTRKYDEENTIMFKQSLYLRERPHDVPNADKMSWWVPIVMIKEEELNNWKGRPEKFPVLWMNSSIETKNSPSTDQILIVNPEEIAPYPVNYDDHNWQLLASYLQSEKRTRIPELTRAKLLHDAWNLAFAGELAFNIALDMTLFLKQERNHLVWDPVFTMIDHLGRHTWPIHEKFQTYIRLLLMPLHEELSQNETEHEENWRKNLRGLAKTFLCQAGWKPCIISARQQFKKWMTHSYPDGGNPISNHYICPVFKYGSLEEWEFGLQRVVNFNPNRHMSDRTYLLKTLAGCPLDSRKITRLLNVSILEDNGNFTETDIFLVFSMLSGNYQGYSTLFHFLEDNWGLLKIKFRSKTNLWDNLITSATSQFTTPSDLEMVSKFHTTHRGEFASAEHIIEKSIRNIKEEAQWTTANLQVINDWLDVFIANSTLKDDKYVHDEASIE